jgi:glycosyltransferase involved in cell wall biosynthesis/GT2 family glycosyltransferase
MFETLEEIMEEQAREIRAQSQTIADLEDRLEKTLSELEEQKWHFEVLHRDRVRAQLVMDCQDEQLKQRAADAEILRANLEALRKRVDDQKKRLAAAKMACGQKGKCFETPAGSRERRPLLEKVTRELRRLLRNFRTDRAKKRETSPETSIAVATQSSPVDRYDRWIAENEPDPAALESQRRESRAVPAGVKISLLALVHNPPAAFLDEMFASVAAQTYENWELCVVDVNSDRTDAIQVLQDWKGRDTRVRIERLTDDFGIAENTNRVLRLATGDFVACLDAADVLAPFALYELARRAAEIPEADIFYSDEDRLNAKGKRHAPFFKPEWSPELLLSCMYFGGLSAYRRSLVLELGGFRKGYDLSRDYDLALRASERARGIQHVPQVLCHRREHPGSGATGAMSEARRTNAAALEDAMRRRNLAAEVVESPGGNRVRLKIESWPRVSIIVPTDSPTRAQACLQDLPAATKYPDLEIVVVTNSKLADSLRFLKAGNAALRVVASDETFNFSDKCNQGAEASTGVRLIFFHDDVEIDQADWIQNLIESLENPEVGAVGPRIISETGQIQHAGLVTGVRGLVGAAIPQRPVDSPDHPDLGHSLRDVSALSGACLAMRRQDFFRVGGFDAVNTPMAYSDVDLCFKIREAGMRCVYTPLATLRRAGHHLVGAKKKRDPLHQRDKAALYLLRRWAGYTTRDPYFPDNMRDWADSLAPIRMTAGEQSALDSSPELLFVSPDLSPNGAAKLLLRLALSCQRNGAFVVVMAPEDGPLRADYEGAGIPLFIDPLILTGHESFREFAANFDCVLANTVRSGAAVRAAHDVEVPAIWWVHESDGNEDLLLAKAEVRSAMGLAKLVLASSERIGLIQQLRGNARAVSEKDFTPDRFGTDFLQRVAEAMAPAAPVEPAIRVSEDSGSRLLFVSHDLSLSGAPMMLVHAARWCRDNGIFVTVLSPRDGPLGEELKAADVPLLVDPSLAGGRGNLTRFARNFDCVIANTIRSEAAVRETLAANIPTVWWVHEPVSVGGHLIRKNRSLSDVLGVADLMVVPSEQAAADYEPYVRRPVRCLRNAIPDLRIKPEERLDPNSKRPTRILLLGSIEPRKGQDLFLQALSLLPREVANAAQFQIAGRVLDLHFWKEINAAATPRPNLYFAGALSHAAALKLLAESDVVVSASRDEAMPTITILEAMCMGKALIATSVGGAGEVLADEQSALLVASEAPDQLVAAIRRCVEDRALRVELGAGAREAFEKDFTMERFGREFRESIDQLVSGRAPAVPSRRS